jgi:glycine/D-amino acid oxidase-like deaminating enzyme
MTITTDVVIFGSGVNGLSIAYELSKRGRKVLIVEKHELGSGASSSCDDMIFLQTKKPGILLEMALRSLELFKSLRSEAPCDLEFDTRGGTILIEDQDQLSVMEDFVSKQVKCGLDVEIIDAKALRKIQPYVSPHVIASTYGTRDSQVNPMLLMRAFFISATKLGMRLMRGTYPVSLSPRAGHWEVGLSSGETVEAESVVNATGAWSNEVTRLLGMELPITPRKGQIIVTEPIPDLGKTNVLSATYIVSKLRPRTDKNADTVAERLGLGFAFTGTENGNYLLGSTREDAGFDKATKTEALTLMAKQLKRFFPIMANIHFIRSFAGFRPSTEDGLPIIGELPGNPGFFVAAGHEGDGIALSPITGRVVADLVERKEPEFDLSKLNPARFLALVGVTR